MNNFVALRVNFISVAGLRRSQLADRFSAVPQAGARLRRA